MLTIGFIAIARQQTWRKSLKKITMVLALLLAGAGSAAAADKPHFRLCTGNPALNYYKAGHILKKMSGNVIVDVIESKGSLDNLDKMTAGECDGAFVQNDAMLVYSTKNPTAISGMERGGVLYREQVHLLCNRKAFTASRMVDLGKDHRVAVGPEGSGANTTWAGFVSADKKRYGPVGLDNRTGERALAAVADGSDVTCMLVVAALNSSFFKQAAQTVGDKVALVGTDDRDMAHTKDARGKTIYEYGEIPADTYPKIQPGGTLYGTKAVPTVQVDAVFVASSAWIGSNEKAYDGLLAAFRSASPDIQALVKPAGT